MFGARNLFDGLVRPLSQLLFPPLCLVCGQALGDDEKRLCNSCLASMRKVSPSDPDFQERLVKLTAEGTISGLVAAFYFEGGGPLQAVVHQLKYSGMTSLGVLLGEQLGERVGRELAGEEISGIVPLPLHRSKERERGYNQSEFVCRGVASVVGVPVEPGLVERSIYTQTQTKLNIEERKRNVAGAFAVRRSGLPRIKGATLLLVDDVVTTGATMQSCAGALIDGGAKKVIACAIALAT